MSFYILSHFILQSILLKKELYGDRSVVGILKEIENKEKDLPYKEKELQKILTNIGENVKNNFQLLDTADSYYMNYDKRKVLSLIEDQIILYLKVIKLEIMFWVM